MGGFGSGRRRYADVKEVTTDYLPLDIRQWQRKKMLYEGNAFYWTWFSDEIDVASIKVFVRHDHVLLDYRHRDYGEEWQHERYPIYLSWTECHLGGQRAWFLCPARSCGRRVAKLYGGQIFACRDCRRLVYASQREHDYERLARRADRIREKLGCGQDVLEAPIEAKPKGMHWKTFERLKSEHDELAQASLIGRIRDFELLMQRLPDGC